MADQRIIDATSLKVAVTRYCEIKARNTRRKVLRECISEICRDICFAIDAAPSADVRENVKGKWEPRGGYYYCSQCGARYEWGGYFSTNFCSNCGADMRGGKDG